MLSVTLPVFNVGDHLAKVHIVIPIYNQWALCHELLWNLFRKERENIASITLVNDCSTDPEVEGGIRWWCSEYGSKYPIYSQTNLENQGFLKSSNTGIVKCLTANGLMKDGVVESSEDIIILISTDVLVHGKFISQIIDIISTNPKSLVGGILYSSDTGWNKFGDKLFQYIEGWLLATTVNGWIKDLQLLDERYAPSDYEDVDLSTTALSLGYELVPLNNVSIKHLGGKSIGYSDERFAQTKINQKKFEEKWIPHTD
jgi:GT2 family glycosyltransferase